MSRQIDGASIHGERGRNRTCDPRLKRALLYQLSYAPSPTCKLFYWFRLQEFFWVPVEVTSCVLLCESWLIGSRRFAY